MPGFLDLRDEGSGSGRRVARVAGRSTRPSSLPKFFYDPLGSRLFEAICELPEYTLTRAERGLFDRHGDEIAARAGIDRPFLDLGAGNCEKAERLFGVFAPSQYVAVDIAADFLQERLGALALRHPGLAMVGLAEDFTGSLGCRMPSSRVPARCSIPGRRSATSHPMPRSPSWTRMRAACGAGGA